MAIASTLGTGILSPSLLRALQDLRKNGDKLNMQLATGRIANNYGDLGTDRTMALAVRGRASTVASYQTAIQTVSLRLSTMQTMLTRFGDLGNEVAGDADPANPAIVDGAQTTSQRTARLRFDESIEILNAELAGHHLFAGRTVDQPPVESSAIILDGDATRAGFKQIVTERRLADVGANGRGRLNISAAAAGAFSIAQDGTHPFGFKLAGTTSTLSNTTVAGPSGVPPQIDVAVTGAVNSGETLRISLDMPDGTREELVFTARTAGTGPSGTLAEGEFLIGATPDDTAANLRAVVDARIASTANVELVAASAVQAGEEFFNVDASQPPLRVDGPPFDTAVALRNGTATDTVRWYKGDDALDDPRATSVARIDSTISVEYGLRANEAPIRKTVQAMASFIAVSFNPADPDAADQYTSLAIKTRNALSSGNGVKPTDQISIDLAAVQKSVQAAGERHTQAAAMLANTLEDLEAANSEEVAMKLLSLQTRLQASYEATSMLSQLTLVNYL